MIVSTHMNTVDWGEPDSLITDPPYSPHVHKNAISQSKRRGTRKRDLLFSHLTPELRADTCKLAARTKRWIVIFSDVEGASLWRLGLQKAGCTYIRTIPWVRWSMPQLSGDRPPTGCEMLVVAWGTQKGRKSWNGPGNLTHFSHKCLRGEGKHKAEKPLDLMLDVVDYFSNKGDLVVDPFAGSGTTWLACQQLLRRFMGAEIDPVWASFANARLTHPMSDRDVERKLRWDDSRRNPEMSDYMRKKKEAVHATLP